MSITVITVADYKTAFPDTSLNNIRDARIQSAINLAFQFLDIKTGCQISKRWEIEEPTTGYLTEEQKEYITRAFIVETQYIIANNMDFSQGSEQTSFGSLSNTSSRPKRDEVCPSALSYLQQAGLYDYLSFSSPSYAGSKSSFSISETSEDDLSKYVTYSVGDLRYVLATVTAEGKKNKYLKTDSNGNITYVDISIPIIENIYTKTECDEKFATYVYLSANYLTSEECLNTFFLETAGVELDNRVHTIEDNYISKTTETNKVYGTNGNGTRYLYSINVDPIAYSIAYRGANGVLSVGTPTSDNNAVNLKYFNEHLPTGISNYLSNVNVSGNTATFTKYVSGQKVDDVVFTPNFDSKYVALSGDQTITGIKNFVTNIQLAGKTVATEENLLAEQTTRANADTNLQNTKQDKLQYIELYGTTGTLTEEQKTILKATPNNYIWFSPSQSETDGNIMQCIYYSPNELAQYGIVFDSGYVNSISVDLSTGVWTFTSYRFPLTKDFAQTISSSSTNNEVPSAKAVYDYIQSLNGNDTSY